MEMRVVRWLGRWAGTGLWVAVLAPSLALLPAAVLDRGPGGGVRLTAFPLGLSALHPFLWECARNSAGVALLVAGMSLWLGTALASSVVRRRYWGRPLLGWLWFAPLAFTPAFAAIGLRGLMSPGGGLDRLAPGLGLVPLAGWVAWAWAGLTTGVPLVALATASALSRVEPAWEDAARLAGASPRRIWRQLVWPVARPASARAAGMAFVLTLVDPGAPLVLGLRRTLAFQVVEACLGPAPGPGPRAALLALATAAIALVGRGLIRWWGRAATPGLDAADPVAPVARALDARWPRASAYLAAFGVAAFLAWLPIV